MPLKLCGAFAEQQAAGGEIDRAAQLDYRCHARADIERPGAFGAE